MQNIADCIYVFRMHVAGIHAQKIWRSHPEKTEGIAIII